MAEGGNGDRYSEETVALAVFRRDPAKNRYIDKENFGVFHRIALGLDEVSQVEAGGMADSREWHRSPDKGASRYEHESDKVKGERAILIQSESHIATLCEEFPQFSDSFKAPGAFGENVLARGATFDAKQLRLGDVFAVQDSTLLLQVTSPRRPCANVDIRHGKMYGSKGVRAFCARTGCAGTFFRVLRPGTLRKGAVLSLKFRQPQGHLGAEWSLYRLSHELYATANASYFVPHWTGTRSDLRALCAEPLLAEVEWKEVLLELLGRELNVDAGCKVLRTVTVGVWIALVVGCLCWAPPIRHDWLEWCVALITMDWSRENMLVVTEFNMLGAGP